jgi:FKBP-type peptidyl-prolyl cis-trans isomerase 2
VSARGRAIRRWLAPVVLVLGTAGPAAPDPSGGEPAGGEPAAAPATGSGPAAAPADEAERVRPGAVVHLRFTLWGAGGEVLDSNRERTPLVFTVGRDEVIPGLERALLGMRVGETRRITVSPEEAYGPVDPAAVTDVPADRLPAEARIPGARVRARTGSGREVLARVREVRDGRVVLDLNHPLAGHTLHFDVEIVLVEPP